MRAKNKIFHFANLFFGLLALSFCAFAVLPVSLSAGKPKPSENKGRYYFRGTCKNCHTKEAVGGEITPLSKTQAQWKRYFASAKHKGHSELLTKVMPEDELSDVEVYLVAHAVDSPQPETCGK